MNKNECYCYFDISGDFDPREIEELLGIKPFRVFGKGMPLRGNDAVRDFASFDCCRCDEYDFDVNVMLRKTLAPLMPKLPLLKALREACNVQYSVRIVPQIYVDEPTPALGPALDVIDFCHELRAEIDVDMYVYDE